MAGSVVPLAFTRTWYYSPECVEVEFSEVHPS